MKCQKAINLKLFAELFERQKSPMALFSSSHSAGKDDDKNLIKLQLPSMRRFKFERWNVIFKKSPKVLYPISAFCCLWQSSYPMST